MKIKNKRGARRTRNQRVKTKRFVTTRYNGCPYITSGKMYRASEINRTSNNVQILIIDDDGDHINPLINGCSHIAFNDWEWGVI